MLHVAIKGICDLMRIRPCWVQLAGEPAFNCFFVLADEPCEFVATHAASFHDLFHGGHVQFHDVVAFFPHRPSHQKSEKSSARPLVRPHFGALRVEPVQFAPDFRSFLGVNFTKTLPEEKVAMLPQTKLAILMIAAVTLLPDPNNPRKP